MAHTADHFNIFIDNDQYITMPLNEPSAEFDPINHPLHYNQGKIEVIDFLEDQPATRCDPLLWQVVRYVCRSPFKSNQVEDLKKARWYLERKITQLGGTNSAKINQEKTNPF